MSLAITVPTPNLVFPLMLDRESVQAVYALPLSLSFDQNKIQELARELLIAISYSVPDTDPNSDHALKIIDGANGAVAAIDKAEKYRSELISISDTSPDAQVPPVVLGNHAG
ncbi:hypothetical protein Gotur_030057 [Gossypium turneri]